MSKKTRILALLVAVLLTALTLTSCAGSGSGDSATTAATTTAASTTAAAPAKTSAAAATSAVATTAASTAPAKAEPDKITMFMSTVGYTVPDGVDLNDNPYINRIKELANVEITELTVPPYTDFATKLNLMLSSNSIPDLVHCWQLDEIGKAGAAGAFYETTDIIRGSAVLSPLYTDEMLNIARYSDGNIYCIRSLPDTNPQGLGVRYDELEAVGITEIPKTVDEWYEAFKAQKAANPNSIQLSGYNGLSNDIGSFFKAYGVNMAAWQCDNGKYIHSFEATYAKDAVQFITKLYDEGLLSKTFVTNTLQDYMNEKYNNDLLYSTNGYRSIINWIQNFPKNNHPETILVAAPYPVTNLPGIDPTISVPSFNPLGGHCAAISSKTKAKDAVVRLIEVLVSEEVGELYSWGVEGVDFTEKDGVKTVTSTSTETTYRTMYGFMFTFAHISAMDAFIANSISVVDPSIKDKYTTVFKKNAENLYASAQSVPAIRASSFVKLSDEDMSRVTEAGELAKSIIMKAIVGEMSLDEYDTQVAAFLEKYKSITEAYNTALADVKTKYGY